MEHFIDFWIIYQRTHTEEYALYSIVRTKGSDKPNKVLPYSCDPS